MWFSYTASIQVSLDAFPVLKSCFFSTISINRVKGVLKGDIKMQILNNWHTIY
jgi:hypothetical protein